MIYLLPYLRCTKTYTMLYTESQLNSYATFLLKKYGVLTEHGIQALPTDPDWYAWKKENNIQPVQEGQPFMITTVDGITINAVIESIKIKNQDNVTPNTI